jgi:hypothetical protein
MNEAGSIYYKTNGTIPTIISKKYTGRINITTKQLLNSLQ